MSGSHPGDICQCWETVFIITTGGASANSMNRSWIMLNILQCTGYRVHTTKMIWHQMSTATRINAQHHWLLEKCKSKLQWGITSHGAEWPSSRNIQTRWWECKLIQSLWRTVWRFLQKTNNRTTIGPTSPTTGHIPWENRNSKRHMCSDVHCIAIYNSQDMEAT